ncbi:MAG: helix-turn-helix transcriptional regulator [Candidatus Acidiferrales bacterium]
MDVCIVVKQRLEELGLEQKDLAAAAGVTDSYISQLLTRKKLPPAPGRTDIYIKMGRFLKFPTGKLSELAEHQRTEELKKELSEPPVPLFKEVRELVLRKCAPEKRSEVHSIFERHPFGELERLVTQKLLDVVQKVAKQELESESWLKQVARLSGRSYEEMRVTVLEFLDTDVFKISAENCISYLDPLIDSWDIDLANFAMEIVLNQRLAAAHVKKLEFVEREAGGPLEEEPGLLEFLRDPSMSGDASEEEIEFLKLLRFKGSRPTALYFYRELQSLRDPLHFLGAAMHAPRTRSAGRSRPKGSVAPMHKHREANRIEKQMQLDGRKKATQRWAQNKSAGVKTGKA